MEFERYSAGHLPIDSPQLVGRSFQNRAYASTFADPTGSLTIGLYVDLMLPTTRIHSRLILQGEQRIKIRSQLFGQQTNFKKQKQNHPS